jgi:hypothetical protein
MRKLKITDVILGRGSGPNQKLGNIRFRQVVWTTFQDYLISSKRDQQTKADQAGQGGTKRCITKDSNDKDYIPTIPDELYIQPIDATAKKLIAQRVEARMKQSDCLFVRKLTEDEARLVKSGHPHDLCAAAFADGEKGKRKIVCDDDEGCFFIEVSTKEAHEKIKQALRFQVQQKERQLKGGHDSANRFPPGADFDVAVAVAVDTTERVSKKTHDVGVSQVSSSPPKKRKVNVLPSTISPERVPREVVFERTYLPGLFSSQCGRAKPQLMFNLLPRSSMMGRASFLSDQLSVDWKSTGHQIPNYSSSVRYPDATAHSSQPNIQSQLSVEEVSSLYVASSKAREAILSAASLTTKHRPVDIQDLVNRQHHVLTLQQQVTVAQQQQDRTSRMLSELLLHRRINKELEEEIAWKESASRRFTGSVPGYSGFPHQIHQIDQTLHPRSQGGGVKGMTRRPCF